METEWIRWEPIDGLSGKYSVDSLIMGNDGLIIQLSSVNKDMKKVEIQFEYAIDAYRYTNDSFCFNTCANLAEKYGREFHSNWTFFKVEDSEYLQWLSEKSSTYAGEFSFTHFCIIGSDEMIDILARYEPTVKFVE